MALKLYFNPFTSTFDWIDTGGGASNSFTTIQTDAGTYPLATSPTDTLTLTSSDGSVGITGNFLTDTVDFSVSIANLTDPKIILVNKQKGDYTSIAAACAAAAAMSPGPTNPIVIKVGPGVYVEPVIQVPSYVAIVGEDQIGVWVEPDAANHHVFELSDISSVNFLTIRNAGSGYAGIASHDTGNWTSVHKVTMFDCDIGVSVYSSTVDTYCYLEYVDLNGTYTTGLKVVSTSGFVAFCNTENFYTYPSTGPSTSIFVDGADAQCKISTFGFLGVNDPNDIGIRITNGAYCEVKSGFIKDCGTGCYADSSGSNPEFIIGAVNFENCNINLNINNSTTRGNFTGFTDKAKTLINSSSSFFITNQDSHIITVAKQGGDYSTIADALSYVATQSPSISNRYKIRVGPGLFVEDTLQMQEWVSIEGSGMNSTIIQINASNKHLILGIKNSKISNCTLTGVSGANYAAVYHAETSSTGYDKFIIDNCQFGANTNHVISSSASSVTTTYIQYCMIGGSGYAFDKGFTALNGARIIVRTMTTAGIPSPYPTYVFKSDGSGSEITVSASLFRSGSTSSQYWGWVVNGGLIEANAVNVKGFGTGIYAENAGSAPSLKLEGVAFLLNTKAIKIDHPGTLGFINCSAEDNTVEIDPNCSISCIITDTSTADIGQVIVGSLQQGDRHDRQINLSKLVRTNPVGWYSGGAITRTGGLNINVAAGNGFLIDSVGGYIKEIFWTAQNGSLTANSNNYIYIDTNGTLQIATSMPNLRQVVYLARAYARSSDILFIASGSVDISQIDNQVEDFMRYAVGPLYVSGSIVSENTTPYRLDVTAGDYFYGSKRYTPSGGIPITFDVYYRDGSGGWNYIANQTTIDDTKYDNGSGTLANITTIKASKVIQDLTYEAKVGGLSGNNISVIYIDSGSGGLTLSEVGTAITVDFGGTTPTASNIAALPFTLVDVTISGSGSNVQTTFSPAVNLSGGHGYFVKHSLYTVGEGSEEKLILVMAQNEYSSSSGITTASLPLPPPFCINSCVTIASIVVQATSNNIFAIYDERPRQGSQASTISSSLNHGSLLGLTSGDAGHTQFVMRDGSKSMTNNFDMGGNSITNVNLVDGVDVSDHKSRHLPNGSDPLTTATASGLNSSSTNTEGTANSFARSDHTHAISGLLGQPVDLTITPTNGQSLVYNGSTSKWNPASSGYFNFAAIYGDGSDGDVTISSGTTTLTRDMYYNNLTLTGTGIIRTSGFRIFVAGTLDITNASAGAINFNGNAGTNASSATGGAAGAGVANASVGGSSSGSNGGNGTTTSGVQAIAATAGQNGGNSGNGGKGGNGSAGSGGAARGGAAVATTFPINRLDVHLIRGVSIIVGGSGAPGGSGGGGDNTNSGGGGGGGGAGAGVLYLAARTIARSGSTTPAGCIQARGGNGGAGFSTSLGSTGGGGGGAGGGGGWLYLIYHYLTGSTATNCLDCSGGAGGNGGNGTNQGGDGGGSGAGGRMNIFDLNTGTFTVVTGPASVNGSPASGPNGGAGASVNLFQRNL